MECKKCKIGMKIINGTLKKLTKKDDIKFLCIKCGHLQIWWAI